MTPCSSVTLFASCFRSPGKARLSVVLAKRRYFAIQKNMAVSRQHLSTAETNNACTVDKQFVLKVGTFNLLAPCYKVITKERRAWWGGKKESSHPELFHQRYDEIFKILDDLPSFDFLCLQEFWFHSDIAELFEKKLGDRYVIYKHKRPTKNDGVALLIGRKYIVKDVEYIKYNDIGMRVALLIHVIDSTTNQEVLIATTHLTYIASAVDHYVRMAQAKKLGQAIDHYITSLDKKDIPLLLCGDFNDGPRGSIYKYFTDLGFISAYKTFHGSEPEVTHLDHKGELMTADYIFYRKFCFRKQCFVTQPNGQTLLVNEISNVLPAMFHRLVRALQTMRMPEELDCTVLDAFLVPKDRSDKEWPSDFLASDHRLMFAEITISPTRTSP